MDLSDKEYTVIGVADSLSNADDMINEYFKSEQDIRNEVLDKIRSKGFSNHKPCASRKQNFLL